MITLSHIVPGDAPGHMSSLNHITPLQLIQNLITMAEDNYSFRCHTIVCQFGVKYIFSDHLVSDDMVVSLPISCWTPFIISLASFTHWRCLSTSCCSSTMVQCLHQQCHNTVIASVTLLISVVDVPQWFLLLLLSLLNQEDDKSLASIIQCRTQCKLKSDKWGLTSITLRQLGNFCSNFVGLGRI